MYIYIYILHLSLYIYREREMYTYVLLCAAVEDGARAAGALHERRHVAYT